MLLIFRAVISFWKDEWANKQHDKLRAVKPAVEACLHQELTCLRTEHIRLTHAQLRGDPVPLCTVWRPSSILHILQEYARYDGERQTFRHSGALSSTLNCEKHLTFWLYLLVEGHTNVFKWLCLIFLNKTFYLYCRFKILLPHKQPVSLPISIHYLLFFHFYNFAR
jgi:hypothetical protein